MKIFKALDNVILLQTGFKFASGRARGTNQPSQLRAAVDVEQGFEPLGEQPLYLTHLAEPQLKGGDTCQCLPS